MNTIASIRLRAGILGLFLVGGAVAIACAPSVEDDVGQGEAAQTTDGGRAPRRRDAGTRADASTLNPPPGTVDNALDVDLVVTAWKKVKADFYDSQSGYTSVNGVAPNEREAYRCMGNCTSVSYYSDLVCHYYCWHPSYEQVVPNVRGCFSYLAQGRGAGGSAILRTDPTTGASRALFYPEIYDYCLYQPYDPVRLTEPAYDPATIAANKASGNKVGVLKWVDDNEGEAFKHVMFTWYNPFAFKLEDQERAINEFYGVQLTKLDYDANDAANVAACRAKRPAAPHDPHDGTHCSSKKVFPFPRARHPNYDAIQAFMQTL